MARHQTANANHFSIKGVIALKKRSPLQRKMAQRLSWHSLDDFECDRFGIVKLVAFVHKIQSIRGDGECMSSFGNAIG